MTTKFIRTYSFVLQIGPFTDIQLHKLYVYLSYLLHKLSKKFNERFNLADDVAVEYYRNKKVFEGSIRLEKKDKEDIDPTQHAGGGAASEDEESQERAKNNSLGNFSFSYEDKFMDFLIDRMTGRNFYQKMMENEEQRVFLMNEMKEEVYQRLRE